MTKQKVNQESGSMNHETHEIFQVTQKLVLFHPASKAFLLVKDARPESYFHKHHGPWELIGGRVHVDEEFQESFIREAKEEAGDLKYQLIGPVHVVRTRLKEISIACIAYLGICEEREEIQLSDEHTELRWETAESIEKSDEYKPWIKEIIKAADERLREREYLTDLKRLQADFDNYKKRQAESQKELGGYLIEKLVLDIVPVLDNFRAATLHVPPEEIDSPWVTGIQYIEKQLETVLSENGVIAIDAEPGEMFDPTIHEAVGTEGETAGEGEQHKIAKVLQKGYKVGNKVVRPARVSVS